MWHFFDIDKVIESNVDIFEQLENKVAKTIQTLETIQLEKMELQEELGKAQQQVAEQQQQLDELQQQNEHLGKEGVRLSHEKNQMETRLSGLMQTLELAVSDVEQVLDEAVDGEASVSSTDSDNAATNEPGQEAADAEFPSDGTASSPVSQ